MQLKMKVKVGNSLPVKWKSIKRFIKNHNLSVVVITSNLLGSCYFKPRPGS